MEPQYKEHLRNEVLAITNDILHPIDRKICGEEPRYRESSLWRTHFASLLALRYIKVALYLVEGYKYIYVIEYRYGREKSGMFPWIWNQEIPIFIKQLTTCDIQCIVLAGLHCGTYDYYISFH